MFLEKDLNDVCILLQQILNALSNIENRLSSIEIQL